MRFDLQGNSKIIIPNTSDPIQDKIDNINQQNKDKPLVEPTAMYGLNTNYAHSNRWVAYFPIQNVLGKEYNNIELNLTRFSIPQIEMGSTETQFKGYTYILPTKVMDPSNHKINFEYIVDEKWANYRSLYTWMSGIEGNINLVDSTAQFTNISNNYLLDVRVWLIDNFKNRILDLKFESTFISMFGDIALESGNTEEIIHSFELTYQKYEIMNAKP